MPKDPASWTLKHPVQHHPLHGGAYNPKTTTIASEVTLAAYEVYAHVYGEQHAMVDMQGRGCRGGFSSGELVAFLYARSFPKAEWSARVDAVFKSMENW